MKVSNVTISGVGLNKTGGIFDLKNFAVFMTGTINVTVSIYNPNKFTINIKMVDVSISYSGYTITNASVSEGPSLKGAQWQGHKVLTQHC